MTLQQIYDRILSIGWIRRLASLPVLSRLMTYEAAVYIFFGAVTTVINWAVFMLCMRLFNWQIQSWGPDLSNAVAWLVAVIFAYVVNKRYVFRSHQPTKADLAKEFALFIAARLLSFAFDQAFVVTTIKYLHMSDWLAKLLSNIIVLILNFIASKLIIFRGGMEKKTPPQT